MTPLVFASIAELEAGLGTGAAESDWMTISQELVNGFAELTGDRQWIHIDVERARNESPFGITIAHGFLTLSLLVPMIQSCVTNPPSKLTINYGFEKIRFVSPVPVGSDIRGVFTPATLKHISSDTVEIGWDVEVQVRDAKRPAVAARWLSRLVGAS
jgi:acyl dehydratase